MPRALRNADFGLCSLSYAIVFVHWSDSIQLVIDSICSRESGSL